MRTLHNGSSDYDIIYMYSGIYCGSQGAGLLIDNRPTEVYYLWFTLVMTCTGYSNQHQLLKCGLSFTFLFSIFSLLEQQRISLPLPTCHLSRFLSLALICKV